jgi:CBS domain-containing protein
MGNDDHPDTSVHSSFETRSADRLVERMFSGFGHTREIPRGARQQRLAEPVYRPLRQSISEPVPGYRLPVQGMTAQVQADSPAIDVMTDLSRVAALSIGGDRTVDEAQRAMVDHGVRALFVVEAASTVLGIITSTDLLGERPIQLAHERGVRHDEILVRDVMTPAQRLEAIELEDVLRARVGDVVASLRLSGRQHALVMESAQTHQTPSPRIVRGIFSLTQIARQLGLPPPPAHNIARTFAEIEAAIGA